MLQIFSKDNGNTTYPPYPTGKPTTSNPGDLGNKTKYQSIQYYRFQMYQGE